jgi:hypothetical protein
MAGVASRWFAIGYRDGLVGADGMLDDEVADCTFFDGSPEEEAWQRGLQQAEADRRELGLGLAAASRPESA